MTLHPTQMALSGHQGAPQPTVSLTPAAAWSLLAGPSPTVHPIQSPQNRFCVLTLDPETLPAIATTLIDVLFYSYRWALFALCFSFHTIVPYPVFHYLPLVPQFCSSVPCSMSWVPGSL